MEFELPVGVDLRLWACGEDEKSDSESQEISALSPGERREFTIEIPTSADRVYFGRVLAGENRSPVAGARVQLVHGRRRFKKTGHEETVEHQEETLLAEQATGLDGLFELLLSSWKSPDIRIQAAGFAPVLLESGSEHDTPEKARVVLLACAANLHARLLDAGGTAVADGAVRLWTEACHLGVSDHGGVYLPSTSNPQWEGSTDSSGLCVLQGLPAGVPLHVQVFRAGQLARKDLLTLSLSPGEEREVEWSLGSGCSLEGFVVDQHDEAVHDRTIWLQRATTDAPRFFQKYNIRGPVEETRTSSDGRFAFSDVSPGKWWIGPAAERDDRDAPDPEGIAPLAQMVEVPEGLSRQEVFLRVHRGLFIRGRVLDPAGRPAPETFLFGETEVAGWMPSTTRTLSDGTFTLGPLVPGRYSVVADGLTQADSEPVEADGGDEGVVLRLKAGGRLSGTVVDGATGKSCAAELTFTLGDDPQRFGMTGTKEDGTFRLEGLSPGPYDLMAKAGTRRIGFLRGVRVREGTEGDPVVVPLAPGALLRVKYAGRAGRLNYCVVSEEGTVAVGGVSPGATSETVVPSGRLMVFCEWPNTEEMKEVEIAEGEETEVVCGGGG